MGGMHGFGPVIREDHEAVFHEAWEGRVYGMLNNVRAMMPPKYPGDNRGYVEAIPPLTYLQMSYYERFLDAIVQRAIENGVLSADELDARVQHCLENPEEAVPRRDNPAEVEALRTSLADAGPASEYRLSSAF